MIPRQEIEFTLAMAEKGVRAETPPDVMAELCRVYLAWLEAPEVKVRGKVGELATIVVSHSLIGKRVRLVVVDE